MLVGAARRLHGMEQVKQAFCALHWLCFGPGCVRSHSRPPLPPECALSFLIFSYWSKQEFSKPLVCITLADLLLLSESLPVE